VVFIIAWAFRFRMFLYNLCVLTVNSPAMFELSSPNKTIQLYRNVLLLAWLKQL